MKRRHVLQMLSAWAGASLLPAKAMSMKPYVFTLADTNGSAPQPYKINFSKDRIQDLHYRLDRMIWPEMPFDTGWSAGTNDRVLKDLVQYWRHEYDWFQEQEKLNKLNHFKVPIEGEQLHFVHYKGTGNGKEFPLLLLHGWPSSFLEFNKAAPLLVKEGYDVIVPSLPGFTFSEAPKQEGVHPGKMAGRMHELMQVLGYKQYGVAGLDWGVIINDEITQQYPQAVVGMYSTGIYNAKPITEETELSPEEQKALKDREAFLKDGDTYSQIQRTQLQTLAYGLQDSPVGLLAWILDKYWHWTDHGDNLWDTLDRNTILNTVMLYWLTGHVLSAFRIYYEYRRWNRPSVQKPTVPTASVLYPKDPFSIRIFSLADTTSHNGMVRFSAQQKGGHHAAMEVPKIWASDVAAFFSSL